MLLCKRYPPNFLLEGCASVPVPPEGTDDESSVINDVYDIDEGIRFKCTENPSRLKFAQLSILNSLCVNCPFIFYSLVQDVLAVASF